MKLIAAALALASLAACGKKDSTSGEPSPADRTATPGAPAPSSASAPAANAPGAEPAADDRCEVTVEGDIKDHGFGPGGAMAAGTDYWMNDEEMRSALQSMARALGDKTADIDADMKKDPRLYTLILNCQTPRTKISLLPSSGTKYADVPFGPKKYKVVGEGKTPGVMQTMVTFEKDTGVWGVDGEGELDITKFDKTGIAGTFAYNMIEKQFGTPTAPPRKAKITGKFAFKCAHATSVCRGG